MRSQLHLPPLHPFSSVVAGQIVGFHIYITHVILKLRMDRDGSLKTITYCAIPDRVHTYCMLDRLWIQLVSSIGG